MMAIPLVIDHERWTIDAMLDHLEHAIDVMGDEHVALGSDFVRQLVLAGARAKMLAGTAMPDGMTLEPALDGLEGPQDSLQLAAAMERRGWDEALRRRVLHQNALRFLASALPEAPPVSEAA